MQDHQIVAVPFDDIPFIDALVLVVRDRALRPFGRARDDYFR